MGLPAVPLLVLGAALAKKAAVYLVGRVRTFYHASSQAAAPQFTPTNQCASFRLSLGLHRRTAFRECTDGSWRRSGTP